jgi:hypothetical protein
VPGFLAPAANAEIAGVAIGCKFYGGGNLGRIFADLLF